MIPKSTKQLKSAALFVSREKLSNAHKLVSGNLQPAIYVRVDCSSLDYETLFSNAMSLQVKGEQLLNTIPLDLDIAPL